MSDDFDDLFDDDFENFEDAQDEDDLFGGDDFSDFGDEDDLGEFEGFEGDSFDSFEDLDDDFLSEGQVEERSGPNRTFVILAGLMIFLFVIGLIVVIFLALRPEGLSDTDRTVTAIVAFNATQEQRLMATQTQSQRNVEGTGTQSVLDGQATETAVAIETENAIASMTQSALDEEASMTASAEAADQEIAQMTLDAQLTNEALTAAVEPQATEEGTIEAPTAAGVGDVQLTATAIAAILQGGGTATLTPGTGGQIATAVPSQLPQTGLFDDATSTQSLGVIVLIAFGLVGVIFGARRLRAMNNNAKV